jgi:hypothetical protein
LPGRMPASNPKRLQRASFWFQSDARFFMMALRIQIFRSDPSERSARGK